MSERPEKVLIVLLGAIGDVTRALPLAVRIKECWPKVLLGWAVEPKSYGVVSGHSAIDKVFLFERNQGFKAYMRFIRELRRQRFDLVLDLQRHLKSGVTSVLSGASRRIGFHRRNSKEGNWLFNNAHIERVETFSPKILQYQKFGDYLHLPKMEVLQFGWEISSRSRAAAADIIAQLSQDQTSAVPPVDRHVALILGSSWPSRFWPTSCFRELIDEMYKRWGLVSTLIGGSGERQQGLELSEQGNGSKVINLVERTSLDQLRSVFLTTRLAIGSDSGPMHIAAAMGIPVISLWGSTSPLRSAPYRNEGRVLQSALACSPCYRRVCPGLDNLCMRSIPVSAVLAHVQREIEKTPEV